MNMLDETSLGQYAHPVFKRDGYACVYCGFDGGGFNGWRQLTVDHLLPINMGGTASQDNLVTACNFCASATSDLKLRAEQSGNEILRLKKEHVAKRLKSFRKFWSEEVAPSDEALTPSQGGTYLPHPLVLDFRALEMTDDQFLKFCSDNEILRFELTGKRELIVMPPSGSETSRRDLRILVQLANWSDRDGRGIVFDSSGGFTMPNGAVRSPDGAWALRERFERLPAEERERFAPICPEFVVELRSPSDALSGLQAKMVEYLDNGTLLGWLIDPRQRRVHIYRPGSPPEILDNPTTVSGETVLPGFELVLQDIW